MTERQKRFVDEYIINGGNATKAALRAGYSAKTAEAAGCRMLRNVKVSEAVAERLKELESERVAKAQETLEFLSRVMRGQVKEKLLTQKGTVKELPARIDSRLSAADKLLKVYGQYREKIEHEVSFADEYFETMRKIAEMDAKGDKSNAN